MAPKIIILAFKLIIGLICCTYLCEGATTHPRARRQLSIRKETISRLSGFFSNHSNAIAEGETQNTPERGNAFTRANLQNVQGLDVSGYIEAIVEKWINQTTNGTSNVTQTQTALAGVVGDASSSQVNTINMAAQATVDEANGDNTEEGAAVANLAATGQGVSAIIGASQSETDTAAASAGVSGSASGAEAVHNEGELGTYCVNENGVEICFSEGSAVGQSSDDTSAHSYGQAIAEKEDSLGTEISEAVAYGEGETNNNDNGLVETVVTAEASAIGDDSDTALSGGVVNVDSNDTNEDVLAVFSEVFHNGMNGLAAVEGITGGGNADNSFSQGLTFGVADENGNIQTIGEYNAVITGEFTEHAANAEAGTVNTDTGEVVQSVGEFNGESFGTNPHESQVDIVVEQNPNEGFAQVEHTGSSSADGPFDGSANFQAGDSKASFSSPNSSSDASLTYAVVGVGQQSGGAIAKMINASNLDAQLRGFGIQSTLGVNSSSSEGVIEGEINAGNVNKKGNARFNSTVSAPSGNPYTFGSMQVDIPGGSGTAGETTAEAEAGFDLGSPATSAVEFVVESNAGRSQSQRKK